VRLQIDVFRTQFLRELPKRLDDLLRLAACVYATDTRTSRGSEKDVFGSQWSRTFRIVLPVWDLDFWRTTIVQDSLAETLQFLTGDEYSFEFVQRTSATPQQGILQFKELLDPLPRVDVVIPFSGGADSFAAILEATQDGRHPMLVSHRSTPVLDSRQKNLVNLLRTRFSGWAFPHISMWVNNSTKGKRPVEFSQRSRSFLFTSLGVVTASLLGIDEVRLCDNGIVSINLPQSGQNVGTFLSRSTHPRFLSLAQKFMRTVTECGELFIHNTLLFKTKKEVLEIIAATGHPEMLQETVSCAGVEGKTKLQPHCGVCSQCIDRRFASVAAELTEHDLASRYEKNIFTDPLDEGAERTHAENYVRFATKLESIQSPDRFFESFSELYDCLPVEGDADAFGQALWNLFQRHQRTVNKVLEGQIQAYLPEIRRAALPTTCLLRIVCSGQHTIDPCFRYVERLRSLICKSLPAAFQTQEARNERQVQDVGESVFQAAQESLHRESPQIPFAAVTTKPDFSNSANGAPFLFIEFKYIKARNRLNGIQTEMTSRVTVYRDQGAWVLFIVYDPKRVITDDDKFTKAFEAHEGIWVGITR
jgi:7-cyano-7-deazaguanine synthase in queuosine biosynthesis